MAKPQLFKRWISVRETNCIIYWIEIYPVDSAIQLLNNWGQYNWTGMVKVPMSQNFLSFQVKVHIEKGTSAKKFFDLNKTRFFL